MSKSTDYWTKRFRARLNSVSSEQGYVSPLNLYVGLYTTDGKEVSGHGYARQEYTPDGEMSFGEATGDWGTIKAFGIFDCHGNLKEVRPVNTPKVVVGRD